MYFDLIRAQCRHRTHRVQHGVLVLARQSEYEMHADLYAPGRRPQTRIAIREIPVGVPPVDARRRFVVRCL